MRGGIISVLGGWLAWCPEGHHPVTRPSSRWDNKLSLPADYLRQCKGSPADALVEYLQPDLFGNTFPDQQIEKFRALRRAWRGRRTEGSSRTLSGMDVHEIISEAEGGPFEQQIPLGSLTAFLAEYWEQEDSDYPSPARLKAMNMGELVEGDDCFLVE